MNSEPSARPGATWRRPSRITSTIERIEIGRLGDPVAHPLLDVDHLEEIGGELRGLGGGGEGEPRRSGEARADVLGAVHARERGHLTLVPALAVRDLLFLAQIVFSPLQEGNRGVEDRREAAARELDLAEQRGRVGVLGGSCVLVDRAQPPKGLLVEAGHLGGEGLGERPTHPDLLQALREEVGEVLLRRVVADAFADTVDRLVHDPP